MNNTPQEMIETCADAIENITNCINNMTQIVSYCIDDIRNMCELYNTPRCWKSNNWLKMHGYPMRRRGRLK